MLKILKSISEFKKEVGVLSKDSTNPFFDSKYLDINQLLHHLEPILEKHNLLVLQPIQDGFVKSIIYHIESGENISSEIKLSDFTNPQHTGSAVTYFRRYTLQSLLGLQAEDDDGNKAGVDKSSIKKESEPSEWLNLFDKQGNKTSSFNAIEKAISEGKKITLQETRKKYKVSKDVVNQLKDNFNII